MSDNRPDVLTWQTDTLTEDITVTGNLLAKLLPQQSGSDADWVVKLIDVYPQEYKKELKMSGYELMIAVGCSPRQVQEELFKARTDDAG